MADINFKDYQRNTSDVEYIPQLQFELLQKREKKHPLSHIIYRSNVPQRKKVGFFSEK